MLDVRHTLVPVLYCTPSMHETYTVSFTSEYCRWARTGWKTFLFFPTEQEVCTRTGGLALKRVIFCEALAPPLSRVSIRKTWSAAPGHLIYWRQMQKKYKYYIVRTYNMIFILGIYMKLSDPLRKPTRFRQGSSDKRCVCVCSSH